MVKNAIYDLVKFLKKPDDKRIQLTLKQKIHFLLRLFAVEAIVSLMLIPILAIVEDVTESEYGSDENSEMIQLFILTVIVFPVIEELVFRYFLNYNRINPKLISLKKWNIIFPWLVYVSAIAFASLHIFNFSFSLDYWFLLPVLVISQFFGGLIITFIRVRLNFYYGVLYHVLWNFSFFMVIPFLVDLIPE